MSYGCKLTETREWTDAEYEAETKRREEAKAEALGREDLRTAITYLKSGMGKSVLSITLPHRYCAALLHALEKAGVK